MAKRRHRGCDRRGRRPGARRHARPQRSRRARAAGDGNRRSRRAGRSRVARHGPGRRGVAGRARARIALCPARQQRRRAAAASCAGSLSMILTLAGGVGGARLALGLARLLPPRRLAIVVNTGDDFEHMGLAICPDLDTVLYTLAGVHNPATGWGRRDETWSAMETFAQLGGETWFRLGDRDLALHVLR